MTVDFTKPVLSMPDGSYVVTVSNPNYPQYNVIENDAPPPWGNPGMPALWQSIQDWLAAGNVATPYVPPAAVALDPVVAAQMQLAALTPDVIDALIAQLPAAKGAAQPDDPISQWQSLRQKGK
jgi:hypothetical protein